MTERMCDWLDEDEKGYVRCTNPNWVGHGVNEDQCPNLSCYAAPPEIYFCPICHLTYMIKNKVQAVMGIHASGHYYIGIRKCQTCEKKKEK